MYSIADTYCIYVFNYYDSVLEKLGKKFNIEFDNKYLTKQQIIKKFQKTKKDKILCTPQNHANL